jgi:hypothetical protein
MMRLLIDGGSDVNAANHRGETPLMLAALTNRLSSVKLLLEKGAKVNAATTSDNTVRNGPLQRIGLTPLFFSAPYGSPELIRTLLDAGAKVNLQDARGFSPLMLAVASETQDVEVTRLLLKAGADVSLKSKAGETALDWALKYGNREVIAALRTKGAKTGLAYSAPARQGAPNQGDVAARLEKSVALLQHSSTIFFTKSGCVGCHHQPMTALAVRAARDAGLRVDEAAAKEQLNTMRLQWASSREEFLQSIDPGGGPDRLAFSLLGLWAAGYSGDPNTDSAIAEVASSQRADGSWQREDSTGTSRAPISESTITATVRALRALQVYAWPARQTEFTERIARARQWLLANKAATGDERAMRLLGLTWAGAGKDAVREAARQLLAAQRADGGWGGNDNLPSDPYATGESLYALRESNSVATTDDAYKRGVQYLLKTQHSDGSWYVRSRAPKFQPYFESDFPFNHDQWISAAATAWATVALATSLSGKEPGAAIAGLR